MNTKKYITRQLFQDLIPIYPLYLLYFESKGLSLQQISALLAIWSLPVVLLEIPTGVLADRWNRRNMIVLGSLCKAACYFVWSFSDSFELFSAGFVLWGIGGALISGAEEALLYDSLKRGGEEDNFDRYYGKGRFLSGVGNILAAVSGGFIGTYLGYRWALYLSVGSCLISAGIAFFYKEVNYYRESILAEQQKKETLSDAFAFLLKKKDILVFSLLGILVVGMAEVLDEYDTVIAGEYGLSMSGIGIWSAVRFILIALGGYSAHHFRKLAEKTLKNKTPIYIIALLCAAGSVCLAVSGIMGGFTVMGFYGIYYLILAVGNVIQEDFIQQRIEGEGRSTVHSILSLSMNLYGILCFGVLGLVLRLTNLKGMLVMIAGYTLIITFILSLIFIRIKRSPVKTSN